MPCSIITDFESWETVCSQNGVQNRFKGARFLTVFDSGDKYADNCVRNTTHFLKVGIGIVMLSGLTLVNGGH